MEGTYKLYGKVEGTYKLYGKVEGTYKLYGKWKKPEVIREVQVKGTVFPVRVMEAYRGSVGTSPFIFMLGAVLIARNFCTRCSIAIVEGM